MKTFGFPRKQSLHLLPIKANGIEQSTELLEDDLVKFGYNSNNNITLEKVNGKLDANLTPAIGLVQPDYFNSSCIEFITDSLGVYSYKQAEYNGGAENIVLFKVHSSGAKEILCETTTLQTIGTLDTNRRVLSRISDTEFLFTSRNSNTIYQSIGKIIKSVNGYSIEFSQVYSTVINANNNFQIWVKDEQNFAILTRISSGNLLRGVACQRNLTTNEITYSNVSDYAFGGTLGNFDLRIGKRGAKCVIVGLKIANTIFVQCISIEAGAIVYHTHIDLAIENSCAKQAMTMLTDDAIVVVYSLSTNWYFRSGVFTNDTAITWGNTVALSSMYDVYSPNPAVLTSELYKIDRRRFAYIATTTSQRRHYALVGEIGSGSSIALGGITPIFTRNSGGYENILLPNKFIKKRLFVFAVSVFNLGVSFLEHFHVNSNNKICVTSLHNNINSSPGYGANNVEWVDPSTVVYRTQSDTCIVARKSGYNTWETGTPVQMLTQRYYNNAIAKVRENVYVVVNSASAGGFSYHFRVFAVDINNLSTTPLTTEVSISAGSLGLLYGVGKIEQQSNYDIILLMFHEGAYALKINHDNSYSLGALFDFPTINAQSNVFSVDFSHKKLKGYLLTYETGLEGEDLFRYFEFCVKANLEVAKLKSLTFSITNTESIPIASVPNNRIIWLDKDKKTDFLSGIALTSDSDTNFSQLQLFPHSNFICNYNSAMSGALLKNTPITFNLNHPANSSNSIANFKPIYCKMVHIKENYFFYFLINSNSHSLVGFAMLEGKEFRVLTCNSLYELKVENSNSFSNVAEISVNEDHVILSGIVSGVWGTVHLQLDDRNKAVGIYKQGTIQRLDRIELTKDPALRVGDAVSIDEFGCLAKMDGEGYRIGLLNSENRITIT